MMLVWCANSLDLPPMVRNFMYYSHVLVCISMCYISHYFVCIMHFHVLICISRVCAETRNISVMQMNLDVWIRLLPESFYFHNNSLQSIDS